MILNFLWFALPFASVGFTLADSALAQQIQTQTNEIVEVILESDREYSHPIRDVDIRVSFQAPDGHVEEIAAFWDGGTRYRFRFSPSAPGRWTYCTTATDITNTGLHGVCGELVASVYAGENIFKRKGWPKVSGNHRYITYGDGDPMFLLSEAALEITWKSVPEEIALYTADRSEKRFNAVWIVPMSHQYFRAYGVNNSNGESYFIDEDISLLNPRYFDYLDFIIDELNEAGIIAFLNPVWGRMASVYEESVHQNEVSFENALIHAKYIGARYAGHNVMWLVAGDATYEEEDEQHYWNSFALELDRASGGRHLMTAHTTGFRGSHSYFPDADWLDFHAYTASHINDGLYHWEGAFQIRTTEPLKPGLSIEYNFEDLYNEFWLFFDDTTGAVRLTSGDVRLGAYQGILSGALAGTSYGANGIWQWGTPETLNGFGIRRTAMEALSMEGSSNMNTLVNLMEQFDWYSFDRFDGLVVSYDSENRVVAAANEHVLMSYFPRQTNEAVLRLTGLSASLQMDWINPVTGESEFMATIPNESQSDIVLSPPSTEDWIVVFQNLDDPLDDDYPPPNTEELEIAIYPNPSQSVTNIYVEAAVAGIISLDLFDTIGRKVFSQTLQASDPRAMFHITELAAGVYFYRISHGSWLGKRSATGTFVRSR